MKRLSAFFRSLETRDYVVGALVIAGAGVTTALTLRNRGDLQVVRRDLDSLAGEVEALQEADRKNRDTHADLAARLGRVEEALASGRSKGET